jgi:hypothetical protein
MRVQTQPKGNFTFATSVHHKVLWASLVTGLAVVALLGASASWVHTAAGVVEMHSSPRTSLGTTPSKTDAQAPKEAYFLDHSVVNRQNLPDEPNPAPMAIAAYE